MGNLLQNYLSILADEASDCSNQEQLSLVIRYVDSDCVVREEFMGLLHCDLGLGQGKKIICFSLTGSQAKTSPRRPQKKFFFIFFLQHSCSSLLFFSIWVLYTTFI